MRLASISVLSILLINIAGYYPVYKIQQWQIRKEIKKKIKASVPEDELYRIKVTKNSTELEWVREDKEFIYDGKMYDIVRCESSGDSITYFCINDTQEMMLFQKLDELVQKNMDSDSSEEPEQNDDFGHRRPVKRAAKIFYSLHYLLSENIQFSNYRFSSPLHRDLENFYVSPVRSCDFPPPRQLS